MNKKKKVFVFGIDGAMPEKIFNEWLDELPNIKKLMQQGCYAKLNSIIPAVSVAAWVSMVTGKNPADHGIFEYLYRKDNSYEAMNIVSSHNLKEKTIWDIASANNLKSAVCFVFLTWPVKPLNGKLVSGALTPLVDDVDFTYPKELKKEINSFLKEPLLLDIKKFRDLSKEEILEKIYKITHMHIDTMKYLVKNNDWDLFFGVIIGSDRINHSFWRYQDEQHRNYEPDSKFKTALKDYYKFLDKSLGEIIQLIPKETTIIVVSDHGIQRMDNRVNLSDWLIKEGYLVLKKDIEINEPIELKPFLIDWTKTKIFALGAYEGQIFINLKGRELSGIVEPGDYDKLIEELERKLKKIPGDDGKKLNTKIFKKKQHFQGKYQDVAPDVIIYFDNLYYGCNTTRIGNSTLWSPQTALGSDEASHSRQGIFIMNDSSQSKYIGEIDTIDVPKTILNKLGITPPEDFKGKIID